VAQTADELRMRAGKLRQWVMEETAAADLERARAERSRDPEQAETHVNAMHRYLSVANDHRIELAKLNVAIARHEEDPDA
jgi:hypothetical protein